ncbi:glycosyltransferase, partial [Desulfovibrio sp. OttesenSCG-928-M14]|nr:glycosyltransferase [Desulfovibrio sp. OttesenSCG-928-M14]
MILLVNAPAPLEAAFREQGRQVTNFALKGGRYSMHSLLEGQSPGLFMQAESLGTRVFITGLEHSPCPTLFWAIDSHLNLFWQRWYSMLFDLVLTPHPSLFQPLPQSCRPKDVRLMAWFGQKRSWTPHRQRAHALAFCGRLTEHRPIRSLLVELLEPEGLHLEKDISFEAMMSMYDQSRVAPNEAIAMESNFRLLEAASSGCLLLSQDVGDDQNCLLQPGKEFLIYHDGLELLDQVRWAASRPEAAEAMGLAAMRRIQAEHLPRHRARMILDLA